MGMGEGSGGGGHLQYMRIRIGSRQGGACPAPIDGTSDGMSTCLVLANDWKELPILIGKLYFSKLYYYKLYFPKCIFPSCSFPKCKCVNCIFQTVWCSMLKRNLQTQMSDFTLLLLIYGSIKCHLYRHERLGKHLFELMFYKSWKVISDQFEHLNMLSFWWNSENGCPT